jgi:hypothetical protein
MHRLAGLPTLRGASDLNQFLTSFPPDAAAMIQNFFSGPEQTSSLSAMAASVSR